MEHYYKIDRSSSLEHGIRDLFRVNRKKKKGSSYREKSKTGDETGVWTNAHGKQREVAGPAWKKKDNDDETRESGKKGNKSKYEGGFITKNGRPNNSQAYNHDYYMKNKDKWYDRVPKNPTESDVKRARMNANSSISAANKMAKTLLKDTDKETVKRLGWDKWTADQIGGAVNRSLESMVTSSRYKRQNSLGQKAKDAAEDVKKKATYYVNRAKNRASELTRKPSEQQNRSANRLERTASTPTADEMLRARAQADQERRNSSHSEPYYSIRKSNNGKNDTSRHANNSVNGRSTPDPNKMSKEYREELEYNSRKNQYSNQPSNSSDKKKNAHIYAKELNDKHDIGTTVTDKNGFAWTKDGIGLWSRTDDKGNKITKSTKNINSTKDYSENYGGANGYYRINDRGGTVSSEYIKELHYNSRNNSNARTSTSRPSKNVPNNTKYIDGSGTEWTKVGDSDSDIWAVFDEKGNVRYATYSAKLADDSSTNKSSGSQSTSRTGSSSNKSSDSNSNSRKTSGNVSWEFGTPTVSDEYKKESEYNSRKNQYPNQSNNSGSDKYVTYKNKNMESGTLYKDKDGNIWKKLGGPGTNNWMKVN